MVSTAIMSPGAMLANSAVRSAGMVPASVVDMLSKLRSLASCVIWPLTGGTMLVPAT